MPGFLGHKVTKLTTDEADAVIKSINTFGGDYGHPAPMYDNLSSFGVDDVQRCLQRALENISSEHHSLISSAMRKLQ